MKNEDKKATRETAGLIVGIPGVIAIFVIIIKMSIIGFYDSDWSWMLPVFIVGFILLFIGYKLIGKKGK